MLTVGELKRAIGRLNDECVVEVNVLRSNGSDEGFADEVSVEIGSDEESAWLSINVEASKGGFPIETPMSI